MRASLLVVRVGRLVRPPAAHRFLQDEWRALQRFDYMVTLYRK